VIATVDGARIGSPAQIHYAQRIDLLKELLEGVADTRQTARKAGWTKRIEQLYQPGRQVSAEFLVEDRTKEIQKTLQADGEFTGTLSPLAPQSGVPASPSNGARRPVWRTTVDLPGPGSYLAAAIGRSKTPVQLNARYDKAVLRGASLSNTDWV